LKFKGNKLQNCIVEKKKKIALQSNIQKTTATEIELFWKLEYLQFSIRSAAATNY